MSHVSWKCTRAFYWQLTTLRSLGLNINLSVWDIKQDTIALTGLISSGALDNMDLIIGPVYSNNSALIAPYANERKYLWYHPCL